MRNSTPQKAPGPAPAEAEILAVLAALHCHVSCSRARLVERAAGHERWRVWARQDALERSGWPGIR